MKTDSLLTLSTQRFGRYAEYLVKLELSRLGFDIYSSEVDDRGIDFLARLELHDMVEYLEIQVKGVRTLEYFFVPKHKFRCASNSYLALVMAVNARPEIFLIPSVRWLEPDDLSKNFDYEGKKSAPEYGLNFNEDRLSRLRKGFSLEAQAQVIHQRVP